METLTCEACNKTWERPLVRGRKPKVCPECKEAISEGKVTRPKATASTGDSKATNKYHVVTTETGATFVTDDERYARLRNLGLSYCCAGSTHLGNLCKREQAEVKITCTCECHTVEFEEVA